MHRMITEHVCFDILTEWKEESSGFSCGVAVFIRTSYFVSCVVVLASNLKKGKFPWLIIRLSVDKGTTKVLSSCFSMKIVLLSWATGSVSSGNLSVFDVIGSKAREIVGG